MVFWGLREKKKIALWVIFLLESSEPDHFVVFKYALLYMSYMGTYAFNTSLFLCSNSAVYFLGLVLI